MARRPNYLNLFQIRLPLPALTSILHRVSGALLFLAIPVLLILLQQSLGSAAGFDAARARLDHPLVKLFLLVLLWAFLHHFFAGIRFLFLDIHIGVDLPQARITAALALFVSVVLTVLIGIWLW
ncbi:MAG TPA: succinate dehydrogenase, cytochrome b556 subunit [Acidiferrobacterales bacterium]|nr:succinate dehydrogenase, cytochrome b556 subunit [Acidiferrobacterales bacterium]